MLSIELAAPETTNHSMSVSNRMNYQVISTPTQLAALRGEWDQLSVPSPMQSHEWLSSWWECHDSEGRELFVVTMREHGNLVGVAPWYIQCVRERRALRWLGDGHACSDHASLIVRATHATAVPAAMADLLLTHLRNEWLQLSLESIDIDDTHTHRFIESLQNQGCPKSLRREPGSCYVDLPSTWNDYLMDISKNHRKRCRRWEKEFFQTRLRRRSCSHHTAGISCCFANARRVAQYAAPFTGRSGCIS